MTTETTTKPTWQRLSDVLNQRAREERAAISTKMRDVPALTLDMAIDNAGDLIRSLATDVGADVAIKYEWSADKCAQAKIVNCGIWITASYDAGLDRHGDLVLVATNAHAAIAWPVYGITLESGREEGPGNNRTSPPSRCGHAHNHLRTALDCAAERRRELGNEPVWPVPIIVALTDGNPLYAEDAEAVRTSWPYRDDCPHHRTLMGLCRWCGDEQPPDPA